MLSLSASLQTVGAPESIAEALSQAAHGPMSIVEASGEAGGHAVELLEPEPRVGRSSYVSEVGGRWAGVATGWVSSVRPFSSNGRPPLSMGVLLCPVWWRPPDRNGRPPKGALGGTPSGKRPWVRGTDRINAVFRRTCVEQKAQDRHTTEQRAAE